jgi:DNA-binding transcriptional LysR family regulator
MDTLKIKIVLMAAKYKSLSRVAEKLSYTPSAVSRTLSMFEKQLGVELFKRTKEKSGCSLPKGIEHPLALLYNLIYTISTKFN